MKPKELCIALVKAEEEAGVVDLLRKEGYWDDPTAWRLYGDKENNFATIGNQQTKPEAALVEKLVNCVDAVLVRDCWLNGMNPESPKAPKSITEAVEKYFAVHKGNLANVDATTRTRLADNINLIATGSKSNPSYIIVDKGEGQTPKAMPNTFLSLTDHSNKLRIPFVQGKFNMGGTGALRFCSKQHNLKLIITRKHPEIAKTTQLRTNGDVL